MSQKVLLCISVCLIAAVVAENDGNSVSDELPSITDYKRFGPLHVVPPPEMRGQPRGTAPPIVITKDSIPFPTLSPEQRRRHLEILHEFQLHNPGMHVYPGDRDKSEKNSAEDGPEVEDTPIEGQNEIPTKGK